MEKPVIMVVDDDKDIRNLVVDFLGVIYGNDFEISVYENGELAWQFMKNYGILIDLMITDLIMPKMDGMTLLKKVKERYPQIKVIMMSGMEDIEIEKKLALGHGADRFIEKPFKLDQLQGAVRELLS